MPKSLLIVESPTKAKTLQKYLGAEFLVHSSKGHIKDLPPNELGVDLEHDFSPKYITILGKAKVIQELKKAAANIPDIYLGPDPDREGEAIAWHIAQALGEKDHRFHRVLFMELTQKAIKAALAAPVKLNRPRYEAQQARRILDRLVGYQISPLLWQKVKTGLSAGRVQSVALRLVCDRERAIQAFVAEEYWSLSACLEAKAPPAFAARLLKRGAKEVKLTDADQVQEVLEALDDAQFKVARVDQKPVRRHPAPPFITSSLQMEANRKLRLPPKKTMRLAQRLYEGVELGPEGPVGLITYMRTDSTRISGEALDAVRRFIGQSYGAAYLPKTPHKYKSPRGAQEAHEAIRPTGVTRRPQDLKQFLSKDELALYDLIWRRFVASQMAAAIFQQTTVDVAAGEFLFRASASVLQFPGFTALYQESQEEEEPQSKLPPLKAGESLKLRDLDPEQHFTKPPARYTEASLIKELEVQGIGRPSTYATILSNLQDRRYVHKIKSRLHPSELGLAVSDLLVENFPDVMDPQFTAKMESDLDRIAEGKVSWTEIMHDFYGPFARELETAKGQMRRVKMVPTGHKCPECGVGEVVVRWGKAEEFLGCSTYPKCGFTQDLVRDSQGNIILPGAAAAAGAPAGQGAAAGPEVEKASRGRSLPAGLKCPKCGKDLVVRWGKMGEFVGCSGYPKCKFTSNFTRGPEGQIVLVENQEPQDFPCPRKDCQGHLVKRRSRRGFFYGCSAYPKCDFTLNQPPVEGPCPQCQFPWLMKKGKKLLCPRECGYQEAAAPADKAAEA
jgi:DNA topoisomerase-1